MTGVLVYGKKETTKQLKKGFLGAFFIFVHTLVFGLKLSRKIRAVTQRIAHKTSTAFSQAQTICGHYGRHIQAVASPFARKKAFALSAMVLPLGSGVGFSVHTYVDDAATLPVMEEVSVVYPEAPVVITFDKPVHDKNYREKILVSPQHPITARWDDDFTTLTLAPQSQWTLGTRYVIALPEGRTTALGIVESQLFTFDTLPYPALSESLPHNGTQDVPLTSAEPIYLSFERASLSDFDTNFVLQPHVNIRAFYDAENKRVAIVPQGALQENTRYTLNVFARYKNSSHDTYRNVGQTQFTTRSAPPELWPEDLRARLATAEKYIEPKILKGKYIDVNLDSQITTLFEDGKRIAMFPASAGRPDSPTPKGEYEIHNKHPKALSQMFQVYLPYWMAFTPDGKYGFHDLPIWPQGHPDKPEGGKESTTSIGVPNSPGCVRHSARDSQAIYNFAEVGTKVIIY